MRIRRRRLRSWVARSLDVVVAVLVTAQSWRMVSRAPSWTVDDAWIVARYADHLAEHGRIAWNLEGGPPVEGFTSLIAVLLGALATVVHVPPIRALTAAGVIALLVTPALLLALARALRAPAGAAAMVVVAHAAMAEHLTHATSGLETEVYVALGLALAWSTTRALRRTSRSIAAVAAAAVALTLTRPEGLVAGALAIVLVIHARRDDGRARRAAVVAAAKWFVAPLAALLIWRLATFGVLVPNTFFAKRAGWNVAHVRDLARIIDARYLDLMVVAGVCAGLARVLPSARPSLGFRRRERAIVVASALPLLAQTLAYARSEPIMDYARRFAVHDLPFLSTLALVIVGLALRLASRMPKGLSLTLRLVFAIATVGALLRGVLGVPTEIQRITAYASSSRDLVEPLAQWILAHTSPSATIAVYPDAGLVPYVTKRRTVDFGKLNDPYLARVSSSTASVVEYFFVVAPDVLVVSQPRPGHLYDAGADAIVADARFARDYEQVLALPGPGGIAYYLYARRGL